MSTAAYEQSISVARGILTSVQADQMGTPTPCESWNVGELVNHLVDAQSWFAAGMKGEAPSEGENWAEGDFLSAFDKGAAEALQCFQEEGALGRTIKLPFGEMPGAAVLGMATTDTFQHSWDVAKATGQDTNLAPELAEGLLAASKRSIQDSFRGGEGAPFGLEQECADGACAADQLAAFLGRKV